MKKQYSITNKLAFQKQVFLYHDGKLITSYELWDDDFYPYINKLEEDGYTLGYTQNEIDEAKRLYENRLANLIGGKEG